MNLLVIGATRFFLRLAFHSSANSPRVPGFGVEQSGTGIGALVDNPLVWHRHRHRLRGGVDALSNAVRPARARGRRASERGGVGRRAGRSGSLHRGRALGMLAALGGAYLALDQHQFSAEMTAGRGFIALAAMIFGRWDPLRAALACLLFAAAETLQIQLQGSQAIPSQFVEMIPYALTIIALAGVVGRAVPPAALGRVAE